MKNILYKNLFDELIDRLDNHVLSSPGAEYVRQKKESPVEIARVATRGMIQLLRTISFTGVPDLVQEVVLVKRNSAKNISTYSFPDQALSEREDLGIVSFVIEGEEVPLHESVSYDQLLHYANSRLYGGGPAFTVDPAKRTIQAPDDKAVSVVILRRPHSIYAPSSLMYAGASITLSVNVAAAGTVTITDGNNGSIGVPVLAADTVNQKLLKIVDAINAEEIFAYDAVFNDPIVQLYHRYDVDTDMKLNPQVVSGGTGTYDVADTGTYELPIPQYYFNDVATLANMALIGYEVPDNSKVEG